MRWIRLDDLVKLATAGISWVTVFVLAPLIPKALQMRSPAELERDIKALAALHDLLTEQSKTDTQTEYASLEEAVGQLRPILQHVAMERPIQINVDEVRVPIGHATSFALILNELVTNAVKHGKGEINLKVEVTEKEAVLTVTDNGPGFQEHFDVTTSAATGLGLVESLASWDLGGKVSCANRPAGGGCVTVAFPNPCMC